MKIGWADNEPFEQKLKRITKFIDSFDIKENRLSIIGVSAGGSAAINAYLERKDKIAKVVFICGKLKGSSSIGQNYYRRNPAFKGSLILAEDNIKKLNSKDKSKMLSLRGLYDNIVPARDSRISGVAEGTMLAFGHILSIFAGLTAYTPRIAKFVREDT